MGSVLPLDRYHYGNRTGIEYVRDVLDNYELRFGEKMPVDVFTIDPYVYPPYEPTNLNRFQEMVNRFRTMMVNKGYRDKELWLKEWGNLWYDGYPPTSVALGARYANDTVNWLMITTSETTGMPSDDNHLVQRWAWFIYNNGDEAWNCGDLDEEKYNRMYNAAANNLSQIGTKYKELILNFAGSYVTPTPTPTVTPTPTPTRTPTPTPTNTLTPTPTITPTFTPVPTRTPTPTPSLTPTLTLSPTPSSTPCLNGGKGNLNCDIDGKIDAFDLSLMLSQWDQNYTCSQPTPTFIIAQKRSADLNQDCKTNAFDLNIILSNWSNKL